MRILVTGALGTLGRPLVAELRSRGHEVWGCDLRHDGGPMFVRADVSSWHSLNKAFATCNPQIVYHLAAEFGRHNGELFPEELWRTGAIGTRWILEMCKRYQSRLMFASSSEIYGDTDAKWLYEDTPAAPMNEYALSKWANEIQIMNYQRRYGLDATRFRFFNAYGPGENYHEFRSVVALFCHRALTGQPLSVYQGYTRTFMYIDDFIPSLANAAGPGLRYDVYNIGGTDYRSVLDLAELVLAEVGDTGSKIDLIPEDRHNVRSKRPSIARAEVDLEHDPKITLEQGVPATIEWMRTNGIGQDHQERPAGDHREAGRPSVDRGAASRS